ncbi:MAG: AMP-binding protein, partial [Clostridia bacterium]|nr:AMP-binding protein [Clostridia bacterium]
MADVVWRPTPDRVERSHLYRFMRRHGIGEYDELFRRSVEDVAWFWEAVAQDLGFEWSRPYQRVMDTSAGIPWTRWFTGGTINLSHNALDRHVRDGRGEQTAIVWEGEEGAVRRLTYREVLALTNRLADALRALGINQGDRVGIYLPMVPEAAVAILATGGGGGRVNPHIGRFGGA